MRLCAGASDSEVNQDMVPAGTPLAVQWLGLSIFPPVGQVQPLVGKLRSCKVSHDVGRQRKDNGPRRQRPHSSVQRFPP